MAARFATLVWLGVQALTLASAHIAAAGYLPRIEKAASFALIDQQGRVARSSDLRGQVVLLAFMYTHCTTVCPIVTERMRRVAQRLDREGVMGKGVRFVSISFDPVRDTPRWLATYSRSVGADPGRWLFLTGSRGQVAPVLQHYDFHVAQLQNGDFDHVSRAYLIDQSGMIRQIYSVSFLDPPRVARDIQSLLAESRQVNRSR